MVSTNLTVSHILVSKPEKIVYLSCRDVNDKIQLYCIYDNQQVKKHDNRDGWQTLNQIFSQRIFKLAEESLYRSPTYSANNISREFVN